MPQDVGSSMAEQVGPKKRGAEKMARAVRCVDRRADHFRGRAMRSNSFSASVALNMRPTMFLGTLAASGRDGYPGTHAACP